MPASRKNARVQAAIGANPGRGNSNELTHPEPT